MATVIEKGTKTSYEIKLERYKRKKKIIIITIAAAVVLIIAFMISSYVNRVFNNYEVVNSIKREDSNTVKYLPYGKNLLKYSKDGVSAIDGVGNLIWNGTYEMKDPSATICEGYVAVADIGGNDIYTVSESGTTNKLEMVQPITQVEVSNQGVVAVLLEDNEVSYIKLFDSTNPKKDALVELGLYVQNSGYPIDIAISKDGKKLVTSFLKVTNGVVESNLGFYNFGEVGKNVQDNLVGGIPYGQTIAADVEFLNNDTVCIYGDDKFSIYEMKEKPKLVYEGTFDTEIKSMFSSEDYVGFVVKNYDGTEKYRLLVYDLEGNVILDKKIDFDFEQVMISKKEIIFSSELEVIVMNIKGEERFRTTFNKSISYIFPINHYNKYFLIDSNNIEQIKLVED